MLILKINRIATAARMAKAATAMDLPRLPPLLPAAAPSEARGLTGDERRGLLPV